MKKITIGIIAHVDSGKTTLSEALLFLNGAIRSFGRVDKGASFLDNDSLERKRGITIYSKQARFSTENTEFVLIDTPGHADFSAEMERTLQVLDYCILLISASDGKRGQTESCVRLIKEYKIPTFVFFNKMDQEGADKTNLFNSFKTDFTQDAVDFSLCGEKLHDQIAMLSEKAMEEFLEEGRVSDDEIRNLILNQKLFPCFFGSALKQEGVKELIKALDLYTVPKKYPDKFGARVYKIMRDSDGSRLTLIKITGGTLANKALLKDGDGESKINQIRIYSGNRFTLRDSVSSGEICAVTGLKESYAGQGFGIEEKNILPLVMPVLSYSVIISDDNDAALKDPLKILPFFKTLEEENPELKVAWDEDTKEISICVMGEVQLEVLTTLLKERFNLNVSFGTGRVMYRETIMEASVGVGHFEPLRHYAEVHLLLEPLPPGSGLVFKAALSTDVLAKNWQRLILTHLSEKQHRGVLMGAPITDMKITLVAGRAHLKHTEGGDFRQAVYRAVRQGLMMNTSKLLEPYYRFVLEVPSACVGRALADLDRLGAEFSSPDLDTAKGVSIITGKGPVSALKDYPKEIAAYTKGLGIINLAADGYGDCKNAEDVVMAKGYDPCADLRNTPDSVFCAHGAGMVVPYDEVYDHMHLPLAGSGIGGFEGTLKGTPEEYEIKEKNVRPASENYSLGTEEIDAIIAGISRVNQAKRPANNYKKRFAEEDKPKAARQPEKAKAHVFAVEDADCILVDGYNVIFAWPELSSLARENIDSARDALIDACSNFKAMTSAEMILVFDAYRVKAHMTEHVNYGNVKVVYTGEVETADHFIERYTNERAKKEKIVVVTSDGVEQVVTRGQGARLISSREFKTMVENNSARLKSEFGVK